MHQHVGMVFPRSGLFKNRHQLRAISDKEGIQIFPLVKGGNERPNFAIARLVVRQQLQFVLAMEIQERTAAKSLRSQGS